MEQFLKKYSKLPNEFIDDFFRIAKESYDDNEFAINLTTISKWFGVTKGNLKRTLVSHFEEDVDYTINKVIKKNKNNNGANYVEIIMLTPNCFRELCMISQTKKAAEVRKYYITLDKLLIKYNQDIQDKLNKEIGILKANQKPKTNAKDGVIYVIRALNTSESLYKLGKSNDLKKRLNTYNSDNSDSHSDNNIEPIFILKVDDIDKVERCVKNIIKDFQYRKYKEVYQIDINVLKMAISQCDELMNGFKKYISRTKKKEYKKSFKKLGDAEHGLFFYVDKNKT